jgi:TolB protein
VDQFKLKEGRITSIQDDLLVREMSDVVYADLDFSFLFEPLRPDTVYLRIMNQKEIDQRGWKHLGADYLIEGEVEFEGDNVSVRYSLTEVATGNQHFRRELNSRRGSTRLMAHALADDIYRALARSDGIFQSRLVYLHASSGVKEVHICDYDGVNDLTVTADRSIVLTPRWAGQDAVTYTSFKTGVAETWFLDLERDQSSLLTDLAGPKSSCSWTENGKRFVLSISTEANSDIYVGERGSRRVQRVTFSDGIDISPSYSPDGSRIVFTSDRGGTPQVYIMDDDGANIERLTYEGHYNDSPDWSPTLDLIAFVSRDEGLFQICTIRPDGGGFRRLTEVGSNENPSWSPDGLHIVFSSNRTGTYEVYTMNFDGTGVRRLTTSGNNSNPGWSP